MADGLTPPIPPPDMGERYVNAFATGVALNLKQRALMERLQQLELQNQYHIQNEALRDREESAREQNYKSEALAREARELNMDTRNQRQGMIDQDYMAMLQELNDPEIRKDPTTARAKYDAIIRRHSTAMLDARGEKAVKMYHDDLNSDIRLIRQGVKSDEAELNKLAQDTFSGDMGGKKFPLSALSDQSYWQPQWQRVDEQGNLIPNQYTDAATSAAEQKATGKVTGKPTGRWFTVVTDQQPDPTDASKMVTVTRYPTLKSKDELDNWVNWYKTIANRKRNQPEQVSLPGYGVYPQPEPDDAEASHGNPTVTDQGTRILFYQGHHYEINDKTKQVVRQVD